MAPQADSDGLPQRRQREVVTLREITDSNRADVLRVAVTPEQSAFVDGVASSLEEAADTPDACPWFRAIYAGVYVLPLH
jgi:hypothetical protein